ncbi:hypothetical protein D3C87_1331900 [compost metagenome]
MGLTPHEYHCMSPLEFHYACNGHLNKYYKELEQTRLIAYNIACTVKRKTPIPNITKWMPLPTDSEKITETDIKRMFQLTREKLKKDA